MKKLRLLLLFILLFPLIIYAKTITTADDDTNINVVVGEVDGSSSGDSVLDFEIKWEPMVFTYNVVESFEWDSITHKYEKNSSKTYWTNNGNKITIINKSAKSFNVLPVYSSNVDYIKGEFNTGKFILNSYATKIITFNVKGDLESKFNNKKIGYITIEIDDV